MRAAGWVAVLHSAAPQTDEGGGCTSAAEVVPCIGVEGSSSPLEALVVELAHLRTAVPSLEVGRDIEEGDGLQEAGIVGGTLRGEREVVLLLDGGLHGGLRDDARVARSSDNQVAGTLQGSPDEGTGCLNLVGTATYNHTI